MTRDDILIMARDAGIRDCTCDGTRGCLERFAALVEDAATAAANARANTSWWRMCKKMVAAEREACAKVCESLRDEAGINSGRVWSSACAGAIRARSET